MTLLDYFVATEADAIHALALVRAGVSVSARQIGVVQDYCAWEVGNLRDAIAALVPGQAANEAVQTALTAADAAMNAAGDKSLSALQRYLAVKKAQVSVAALAMATVGT
jgi:hypothetical protein